MRGRALQAEGPACGVEPEGRGFVVLRGAQVGEGWHEPLGCGVGAGRCGRVD